MDTLGNPVSQFVDAVADAAGIEPDPVERSVDDSTASGLDVLFACRVHDAAGGSGRVQVA